MARHGWNCKKTIIQGKCAKKEIMGEIKALLLVISDDDKSVFFFLHLGNSGAVKGKGIKVSQHFETKWRLLF